MTDWVSNFCFIEKPKIELDKIFESIKSDSKDIQLDLEKMVGEKVYSSAQDYADVLGFRKALECKYEIHDEYARISLETAYAPSFKLFENFSINFNLSVFCIAIDYNNFAAIYCRIAETRKELSLETNDTSLDLMSIVNLKVAGFDFNTEKYFENNKPNDNDTEFIIPYVVKNRITKNNIDPDEIINDMLNNYVE